jgi:hypothetical protein
MNYLQVVQLFRRTSSGSVFGANQQVTGSSYDFFNFLIKKIKKSIVPPIKAPINTKGAKYPKINLKLSEFRVLGAYGLTNAENINSITAKMVIL